MQISLHLEIHLLLDHFEAMLTDIYLKNVHLAGFIFLFVSEVCVLTCELSFSASSPHRLRLFSTSLFLHGSESSETQSVRT